MTANDVVRVRIDSEMKARLMECYAAQGRTISDAVRGFLEHELEVFGDPLAELDALAESAVVKAASSGFPDPTVDDLVSYVDSVRAERASQMVTAS